MKKQKSKRDLANSISNSLGVSQDLVSRVLGLAFTAIEDAVVSDGRIELREFGVFQCKKVSARDGYNPKTREKVDIPETIAVRFKSGKRFTNKLIARCQLNTTTNISEETTACQQEETHL